LYNTLENEIHLVCCEIRMKYNRAAGLLNAIRSTIAYFINLFVMI